MNKFICFLFALFLSVNAQGYYYNNGYTLSEILGIVNTVFNILILITSVTLLGITIYQCICKRLLCTSANNF